MTSNLMRGIVPGVGFRVKFGRGFDPAPINHDVVSEIHFGLCSEKLLMHTDV